MLMLKTTHDRIVADDAKKLGENAELIAKLIRERDECKATAAKVFRANLALAVQNTGLRGDLQQAEAAADERWEEITSLRTRLAPFTTKRLRDEKGLFLSTKGEQA